VWDDLDARARGLGTHFLNRSQLEALAREPDLPGLAEALRRQGIPVGESPGAPQPEQLELGLRRWAAAALRIVGRWAGHRAGALPLMFDAEDRRSLRAIFRGVVQRTSAERRMAGLIPTPALPERALEELARQPTVAAAAALLTAWRHPFAPAVAPIAAGAQPDLFALDVALSRALVERATRAARESRDASVRAFVRETIDIENGLAALLLATEGKDVVPKDVFLPGGERVSIIVYEEAVALREPRSASARIAAALKGSEYAEAFRVAGREPAALEQELLREQLRVVAHRVRRMPLGPLPVVLFGLRLRAQVFDLQRVIWTVALGAPRLEIAETLVTAL
jgi:vacuolar-type H+-ATPase subunit C/Vma6